MRTLVHVAVITALLLIQSFCSASVAGELSTGAVAKPNPDLHASMPRCPAGSAISGKCRAAAEKRSDAGKLAAAKVAIAPSAQIAPPSTTCPASGLSSAAMCGGSCVDLRSDASNCGRCSNQCNATLVCQYGVCGCPAGQQLVDGSCARM